jgi:hypothetical protein
MLADPVRLTACPGCGAPVPDIDGPTHAYLGASPGCWAAWGAFQARSFASPAIAAVQPLAVDVYAVQHPGLAERRAIQSVWAHLVSLCLILERDRPPADGIRAKQQLLAGSTAFSWLEPPVGSYAMTVLDMTSVEQQAVPREVRRWADVTWAAWRAHHAAVRERAEALGLTWGASADPPR